MTVAGEAGILLAYAVGILGIFVIVSIFSMPIKIALRLVLNGILGGVAIVIINTVGSVVGIHISLNVITAAIVGILGIPGALALILIEFLF